jgi:hypothetical protein
MMMKKNLLSPRMLAMKSNHDPLEMPNSRNYSVSSRNGYSSNKVARIQSGYIARRIGTKAPKRRESLDALRRERHLEKQETAKAMIEVMKDIR